MTWGCFAVWVLDSLPSSKGKMNPQVYQGILQDNAVCQLKLSTSWVMPQDAESKHRSKSMTE